MIPKKVRLIVAIIAAVCIFVVAGLCISAGINNGATIAIVLCSAFAVIFISYFIFYLYTARGVRQLNKYANPKEAIRIGQKHLEQILQNQAAGLTRQNTLFNQRFAQYNMAVFQSADGDYINSIKTIEWLADNSADDPQFERICRTSLATLYHYSGQDNAFMPQFERVLFLAANMPAGKNRMWGRVNDLEPIKAVADIVIGQYEPAEVYFKTRFEGKGSNLYVKCSCMYELAIIYNRTNNTSEMTRCFEWLAEHGNDLYFARMARQKLLEGVTAQ